MPALLYNLRPWSLAWQWPSCVRSLLGWCCWMVRERVRCFDVVLFLFIYEGPHKKHIFFVKNILKKHWDGRIFFRAPLRWWVLTRFQKGPCVGGPWTFKHLNSFFLYVSPSSFFEFFAFWQRLYVLPHSIICHTFGGKSLSFWLHFWKRFWSS